MNFKENIRDTVEVYANDMVIKSKEKKDHITPLKKSFNMLQKYT